MILAAITAVGIFLASHHEPKAADCERNPGVLVEEGAWHYGVYRNSLCHTAPFIHRYWELVETNRSGFKVGFSAGPTLGYSVPFTAWFRVTYGPVALYVVPPLPPLTGSMPPVVGLALRYEFK